MGQALIHVGKKIPMFKYILSLLLLLLLSSSKVWTIETGRICLAPLPKPRQMQVAPWEVIGTKGATDFYVKIGDKRPEQLYTQEASWISSIELEKEYTLQILKENAVQE